MESEEARRSGGAKSPTSGNMIWGVTVVTAVMNEIPVNVANERVTQRPILDSTQAGQFLENKAYAIFFFFFLESGIERLESVD